MIVPLQRAARAFGSAAVATVGEFDEVDVEPAVVVEIEERHAAAHRFDDVLLFRMRMRG